MLVYCHEEKLAVGSRQFAVKAKTSFFARQDAAFKRFYF